VISVDFSGCIKTGNFSVSIKFLTLLCFLLFSYGRGKVVPLHGHEDIWKSEDTSLLILNLSTRCRGVISFMPQPLYPKGSASGTHRVGGWVDPRTGVDALEKR
jgi:hypothetical protein